MTRAFDHVRIGSAVTALRRLGDDPALADLAALTAVILRGSSGHQQEGLPQGGATSPTVLNAQLHDALDIPMTAVRGGHPPAPNFYRYADNVAVLTGTAAEGQKELERMRDLLDMVGLILK